MGQVNTAKNTNVGKFDQKGLIYCDCEDLSSVIYGRVVQGREHAAGVWPAYGPVAANPQTTPDPGTPGPFLIPPGLSCRNKDAVPGLGTWSPRTGLAATDQNGIVGGRPTPSNTGQHYDNPPNGMNFAINVKRAPLHHPEARTAIRCGES